MSDTKQEKTISVLETAKEHQISLSAAEYRIEYNISSIEDCQNASEEVLCEFIHNERYVPLYSHIKLSDDNLHNLDSNDLRALYAIKLKDKQIGVLTNTKTRVITTN